MKAFLEKVDYNSLSFAFIGTVERNQRLNLETAYHYHSDYELIWTQAGRGTRYIGHQISKYRENELVFLGGNIPHCWITAKPSKQLVIKIKKNFLDTICTNSSEFISLSNMLSKSYRGIEFYGKTKATQLGKLNSLAYQKPFIKMLTLLDILNELANSKDANYINAPAYKPAKNQKGFNRIKKLYGYIQHNMQKDPSLMMASEALCMSKSALCKFIKRATARTFTEIVNEIRIQKAADLLINSDKTITQIAYTVGYNDISTFFRQFKLRHLDSPKKYRKKFATKP